MTPSASIVIPTYNRAGLVVQAIGSCVGQLPDGECQITVVDDSSTDATADVVRRLDAGVKYVNTTSRSGQAQARNLGLSEADGRWIKFLDSDDVLEPGALAKEIGIGDQSGADIVISGWGEVGLDENGVEIGSTRKIFEPPEMLPTIVDAVLAGKAVPTSAALYRRPLTEGRRWDKPSGKLDDWDWFCQMALRAERIERFAGPAYWLRLHSGDRVSADRPMIENARCHQHILYRIEALLRDTDRLTPHRRCRLAQYFYKELRVLCLDDPPAFEAACDHILDLDPEFVPRDEETWAYMRLAGRVLGFRRAVIWHAALKRSIKLGFA